MDLSTLSATTPSQPTPSNAGGAFSQLTSDFDTFLTLLTTQLQNQDPLEPLDTEQFTQQLVQFAGVEQSIQTNSNLEALIALQTTNDRQASIDLVGRVASVSSNQVQLDSNTNTPVTWRYTLPQNANDISITVTDVTGATVATLSGPTQAGTHDVQWNGILANGSRAPAGPYQLQVSATVQNGSALTANVESRGAVESVLFTDSTPQVLINGTLVNLDAITRVDAQF